VVFVDSDAAGVSGVISEFKTDALCYEAADRIEELEKENFILAATQCPFPDGEGLTGSPSGYSYCAKDVELEGCDEYIQSLIKTIEEADEQIEELETKLEKAEKIQKP
jgi:formyltetrahydrofolate synthetase